MNNSNQIFQSPLKIDITPIKPKKIGVKKSYALKPINYSRNVKVFNMANESKLIAQMNKILEQKEALFNWESRLNDMMKENFSALKGMGKEYGNTANVLKTSSEMYGDWTKHLKEMWGITKQFTPLQRELHKLSAAIKVNKEAENNEEVKMLQKMKHRLQLQNLIQQSAVGIGVAFKTAAKGIGLALTAAMAPLKIVTGMFNSLDESLGGMLSNLIKIATNPLTLITTLITLSFKRMEMFSQATVNLGRNLGVAGAQLGKLSGIATGIYERFKGMGVTLEEAGATIETMVSKMGNFAFINKQNVEYIFKASKFWGVSADEAAEVYKTLFQMGKGSMSYAKNLMSGTKALSDAAGVPIKSVMNDLANLSSDVYGFMGAYPKKIIQTTVEARRLGMTIDQMAKVSKGLLNVQDSISSEMEASILTGKNMNLDLARRFALEGKIEDATKEVLNQVGGIDEFNRMNIFQKEAISKAAGMEVKELQRALEMRDIAGEQLTKEEKQQKKINDLMDTGNKFADKFNTAMSSAESWKQFFEEISRIFAGVFLPDVEKFMRHAGGIQEYFKGMSHIIVDKFLIPAKEVMKFIVKDIFGMFEKDDYKDSIFTPEGLSKLGDTFNEWLPKVKQFYTENISPVIESFKAILFPETGDESSFWDRIKTAFSKLLYDLAPAFAMLMRRAIFKTSSRLAAALGISGTEIGREEQTMKWQDMNEKRKTNPEAMGDEFTKLSADLEWAKKFQIKQFQAGNFGTIEASSREIEDWKDLQKEYDVADFDQLRDQVQSRLNTMENYEKDYNLQTKGVNFSGKVGGKQKTFLNDFWDQTFGGAMKDGLINVKDVIVKADNKDQLLATQDMQGMLQNISDLGAGKSFEKFSDIMEKITDILKKGLMGTSTPYLKTVSEVLSKYFDVKMMGFKNDMMLQYETQKKLQEDQLKSDGMAVGGIISASLGTAISKERAAINANVGGSYGAQPIVINSAETLHRMAGGGTAVLNPEQQAFLGKKYPQFMASGGRVRNYAGGDDLGISSYLASQYSQFSNDNQEKVSEISQHMAVSLGEIGLDAMIGLEGGLELNPIGASLILGKIGYDQLQEGMENNQKYEEEREKRIENSKHHNKAWDNYGKKNVPTTGAPGQMKPTAQQNYNLGGMLKRLAEGGILNANEIAGYAKSAGVSNTDIATAIALAESGGNPNINNAGLNKNGTVDYGLWQINSVHNPPIPAIYKPSVNAKYMSSISSGGSNWNPWSTYKSGAYKAYLGQGNNPSKVDGMTPEERSGTSMNNLFSLMSLLPALPMGGFVFNTGVPSLQGTGSQSISSDMSGVSDEDFLKWISTTNSPEHLSNLKSILKNRLTSLAKSYGKPISILSGYRSMERQQQLWDASDKSGKWVGRPGGSKHNYGLAVDVNSSWIKSMGNDELKKFGLWKPMSYENWHVEPMSPDGGRIQNYGSGGTMKVNSPVNDAIIKGNTVTPINSGDSGFIGKAGGPLSKLGNDDVVALLKELIKATKETKIGIPMDKVEQSLTQQSNLAASGVLV